MNRSGLSGIASPLVLYTLGWLCLAEIAYANSYSTSFPNTETPLSEGGHWIQGQVTGANWSNVDSLPGMAYGTQAGGGYNDSTASLTGTWGPDQSAQATAVVRQSPNSIAEVELRLRTSITPGRITGYEFNYSVAPGQVYAQIVRWNGPINDFTLLDSRSVQINSGDVIKATAVGSTLTTYVNGAARYSVTDSTYSNGSPGVGFYVTDGANNQKFGLTNFSATDNGSPPSSPTPSATPLPQAYAAWELSLLSEMQAAGIQQFRINTVRTWLANNPPKP